MHKQLFQGSEQQRTSRHHGHHILTSTDAPESPNPSPRGGPNTLQNSGGTNHHCITTPCCDPNHKAHNQADFDQMHGHQAYRRQTRHQPVDHCTLIPIQASAPAQQHHKHSERLRSRCNSCGLARLQAEVAAKGPQALAALSNEHAIWVLRFQCRSNYGAVHARVRVATT